MRIAVAVYEGQPQHPHVEAFDREEEPLGGELAHRVGRGRRAGIVLLGKAATIRTVDQAGAREDEALHGGGTGGLRQVLRAEIIDGVRFVVTNRDSFDSTRLGLELAYALNKLYPGRIAWQDNRFLIGNQAVLEELKDGTDPRTILQEMENSLTRFMQQRERYLLYR